MYRRRSVMNIVRSEFNDRPPAVFRRQLHCIAISIALITVLFNDARSSVSPRRRKSKTSAILRVSERLAYVKTTFLER